MKSTLTFFTVFLILTAVGLPIKLAYLSIFLRNVCERSLPSSNFAELNAALICGVPLQNPHTKALLQSTGLIHLIVVSGSHLIFLQQIIAYLLSKLVGQKALNRITILCLFTFTIVTGLQAPCVRAFIQIILHKVNTTHKLFWKAWSVTLLSGCICLAFFPNWLQSTSLLMSWICALAISLTQTSKSSLLQHAVVYFTLLPILAALSIPHPFVIFVNMAFTPIFGIVLFPITLLSVVLPFLTPVSDGIWQILTSTLSEIAPYTPSAGAFEIMPQYQWLFLLVLHLIIHHSFLKRAQNA